jgi:glycerophosphoryl diester phosphodiesterase
MEIIGHRGAMGLATENSLDGISKALSFKADVIELDVRMQTGILVLSHGPINKTQVYCPLAQALNQVTGKAPLNLEIKESRVVNHLKKALEGYKGDIIFSSFKYRILQDIKKVFPDAEIANIEKWSGIRAVTEATLLDTKRIHINEKWLWSGFVHSMNKQGFKLYAYTVNSPERAKELEDWGVVGIFTDYPDRFQ